MELWRAQERAGAGAGAGGDVAHGSLVRTRRTDGAVGSWLISPRARTGWEEEMGGVDAALGAQRVCDLDEDPGGTARGRGARAQDRARVREGERAEAARTRACPCAWWPPDWQLRWRMGGEE